MSTEVDIKQVVDNKPCRVYLVTYSKLDHRKFPTRMSFGAAVVEAFDARNVDYFVATKEKHEQTGYHYHVAIQLNKATRWNATKTYLKEKYNVVVNFSTSSSMYAGV